MLISFMQIKTVIKISNKRTTISFWIGDNICICGWSVCTIRIVRNGFSKGRVSRRNCSISDEMATVGKYGGKLIDWMFSYMVFYCLYRIRPLSYKRHVLDLLSFVGGHFFRFTLPLYILYEILEFKKKLKIKQIFYNV